MIQSDFDVVLAGMNWWCGSIWRALAPPPPPENVAESVSVLFSLKIVIGNCFAATSRERRANSSNLLRQAVLRVWCGSDGLLFWIRGWSCEWWFRQHSEALSAPRPCSDMSDFGE